MLKVVQLAGRSRPRSETVWRGAVRLEAVAESVPNAVPAYSSPVSGSCSRETRQIGCRHGARLALRKGPPWQVARSAGAAERQRDWSNGVLGMNLGMAPAEGALLLRAIGLILMTGLGVATACLLVFMVTTRTLPGNSGPAASQQVLGMAAPVEQTGAMMASYEVAGGVLDGWMTTAGNAYRASALPLGRSFLGIGGGATGGFRAGD